METDKRQIGPVTTAAGGGVAVAGVICWLFEEFTKRDIPDNVENYVAIILAIAAGWAVRPHGKRVAL